MIIIVFKHYFDKQKTIKLNWLIIWIRFIIHYATS